MRRRVRERKSEDGGWAVRDSFVKRVIYSDVAGTRAIWSTVPLWCCTEAVLVGGQ